MLYGGFGRLEAATVKTGDAYEAPNWLYATNVNL